eukprot:GHVR01185363.1.p1 GENE.GHVR01185363.1~~GHVR01185363.1.p1  ORF type:complete len:210 (+),score=15.82 GHVR01185363.1:709-1338(+)
MDSVISAKLDFMRLIIFAMPAILAVLPVQILRIALLVLLVTFGKYKMVDCAAFALQAVQLAIQLIFVVLASQPTIYMKFTASNAQSIATCVSMDQLVRVAQQASLYLAFASNVQILSLADQWGLICKEKNNFISCTQCDDTYFLDTENKCRKCSDYITGADRCRDEKTPTQCLNDYNNILSLRYYLVGVLCVQNVNQCKKISDLNGNCA